MPTFQTKEKYANVTAVVCTWRFLIVFLTVQPAQTSSFTDAWYNVHCGLVEFRDLTYPPLVGACTGARNISAVGFSCRDISISLLFDFSEHLFSDLTSALVAHTKITVFSKITTIPNALHRMLWTSKLFLVFTQSEQCFVHNHHKWPSRSFMPSMVNTALVLGSCCSRELGAW